jgi:hypothetical protein
MWTTFDIILLKAYLFLEVLPIRAYNFLNFEKTALNGAAFDRYVAYFFPLWRPRSWRDALRIGGVALPMCFVERIGFFIEI